MTTDTVSPPIHEARVNPPQAVTDSLGALQSACAAWPPVTLEMSPVVVSREALLCDQITGRTNPADDAYHVGLVAGLFMGVGGLFAAIRLYFLLRNACRRIGAARAARSSI